MEKPVVKTGGTGTSGCGKSAWKGNVAVFSSYLPFLHRYVVSMQQGHASSRFLSGEAADCLPVRAVVFEFQLQVLRCYAELLVRNTPVRPVLRTSVISSSGTSGTTAYNATKAQSCGPFPNFSGLPREPEPSTRTHRLERNENILLANFIRLRVVDQAGGNSRPESFSCGESLGLRAPKDFRERRAMRTIKTSRSYCSTFH